MAITITPVRAWLDLPCGLKYFPMHKVESKLFMLSLTKRVVCFAVLALLSCGRSLASDWLHVGFLYDDFQLTLAPGHRMEALGPLFYSEEKDTQKTWALPPLFSDVKDPAVDSEEYDFLYPILTYDRYGSEHRWQLIQVLAWAGGQNQEEQKTKRFTLFPFYFQQRSEDTNKNYTAFFPIYGHLKNRLFRDEIFFVMFPIYGQSRKGDVVTDNYVYPFFHLRHGNELNGWQVWPIMGREHKGVTTKTNGFGETQVIGGHETLFVMWPIYFNQLAGIGTQNPTRTHAVLPLFSTTRSINRDSTTVIWPFFSHITEREKKYKEWETPWPIVVFARGEGKTTSRVWPFYSQAHTAYLESDWYMWPIYKFNRVHSDPLDRTRMRILFFLYSDTIQKNTETKAYERRRDFWPLYTHKRNYDGSTRLQLFAPLEPILPNNRSVERDYSPVWSVWRAEKNAKTGATSQSLLWNLYRRDTAPASKKCSLLFGLFQYQSGTEGKRVRLFYIPVVKSKPAPAQAETK